MSFDRRSEQISDLFAALAKAQGEFPPIERAGDNPHFRSSYATLGSVVEATRDPCAKHGLCLIQMPTNLGDAVGVTTLLGHSSGQWIESTVYASPTKADAQGLGSVITYLRRYARMAVLGLAAEDDDGNAAVKPAPRYASPFSKTYYPDPPPDMPLESTGKAEEGHEAQTPARKPRSPKAPQKADTGVALLQRAKEAAYRGTGALQAFWESLPVGSGQRAMIGRNVLEEYLRPIALKADAESPGGEGVPPMPDGMPPAVTHSATAAPPPGDIGAWDDR